MTGRARVLLIPPLPAAVTDVAVELLPPGLELLVADPDTDRPRALAELGRADAVIGYPWALDRECFTHARGRVALIQLLSAGYDALDLGLAAEAGIPVATNGGANAVSVAEHALTLTLSVLKQVAPLHERVRAGAWTQARFDAKSSVFELTGKTVGVVGLGKIGRALHSLLQPFGVTARYHDPVRDRDYEARTGIEFRELDDLLAESDVVSIHAPYRPGAGPMIGASRLAGMRPGAILINTSRGEHVDESALYQALTSGRLRGAGLDVLREEPPAADNPLLGLPNCLITPHTAGPTWDSWHRRFRNGYANIERVLRGQRPHWTVGSPEAAGDV